jgi:hypothetical protein
MATPEYRSPTPEISTARTDLVAGLERAIAAIQDSESFRRYLDTQARFHRYSFGNTLLILLQRPDSTQVAGFQAWRKLGRQVRRAEKGIAIVVPHVRKTTAEADEGEERRVTSFGTGHVFDVSQTDGEPLPAVAVPILEGKEGEALFARLRTLTGRENLVLECRPVEQMPVDVMGFYSPTERLIVVREAAPLQMTKTLAHELGHHFAGRHDTRAESETIAESVAYVVCAHHGVDTGERSFPYIAIWSKDAAAFRAALGSIQQVSARMIDCLAELPDGSSQSFPGTPVPQPLPPPGQQLRLL